MKKSVKLSLLLAVVVTAGAVGVWQATGGDAYTKFQVVEEVPRHIDPDDPLADAGFYDENATETVIRDEFRFGLLPTPQSILDKHMLSVVSVASPFWAVAVILFFVTRHRQTKSATR